MNFLKKAISLFAAFALCCGFGVAATACGDKDNSTQSSSSTPTQTVGYHFLILDADENPTDDYKIQLCVVNADGSAGTCLSGYATPDASGKAFRELSETERASAYVIHLFRVADDSKVKDTHFMASGISTNNTIPANFSTDSVITITLSASAE